MCTVSEAVAAFVKLHLFSLVAVSLSVVSDFFDSRDYSLPGSCVHGVL